MQGAIRSRPGNHECCHLVVVRASSKVSSLGGDFALARLHPPMFHSAVIDRLLDLVPVADLGAKTACVHANGLDIPAIGINLDSRPDKWRILKERMSAIGFDRLMRARAVEGAKLPDDLIEKLLGRPASEIETAPEDHLRLTRPAIGCFLSHLSIWRWMQANGIERAIVFEDDARPSPHFDMRSLRETVAGASDRKLVFLGALVMHGMAEQPSADGLARLYYFNGTFAYLVTRDACSMLLRQMLPLHSHIDHQMSRLFVEQRDVFPVWHSDPGLFEPDWALGSDICLPMANESAADRHLRELLESRRQLLLSEGRLLNSHIQAGAAAA
jgi:glycosyl transferase family 25